MAKAVKRPSPLLVNVGKWPHFSLNSIKRPQFSASMKKGPILIYFDLILHFAPHIHFAPYLAMAPLHVAPIK